MLSAFSPAAAAVSDRSSAPLSVSFSIGALAEPGIMPRVLELFAKRGLVPQRWNSTASDAALSIDVQMTGLDRDAADYIARCMRQIHGVETVFTVESRHAA
jgi:acetolactate synthase regulatory subunit